MADYKLKFTAAEIDEKLSSINNKQDKLIGARGQVVGFDVDGNAVATDDNVFVAIYGSTTCAEIEAALLAGKAVIARVPNSPLVYLLYANLGSGYFRFCSPVSACICQNDVWSYEDEMLEATYTAKVNTMIGASSSAAGSKGSVPAPAAGDEGKFLKGDGTWGEVDIPTITSSTTDLTAGTSPLATGSLYLVYE